MNWLYYLAEANFYLCVFYVAYCVLLAKETHYQLNRGYLLFSCLAAFILPLVQLNSLKPSVVQNVQVVDYAVMPTMQSDAVLQPVNVVQTVTNSLSIMDYLYMVYLAGLLVASLLLFVKLYTVFKLMRNKQIAVGGYKMVYLDDTNIAFSFFNYMFIGVQASGIKTIITHELVHMRQKHSADIIFLELLKVLCWFNPIIYSLQNSLKTIHEYIADEHTAAGEEDAIAYSSFLVTNAYGAGGSSITHSFFNYNLLKKRIIMLNQKRSGSLARLKYLIALPAYAGMLCASTLAFSKNYGWLEIGSSDIIKITTANTDTLKTKNGYKYTEAIVTKNGIKTATVTFYEQGGKKSVFRSTPVSGTKISVLKDKYGYEFPAGTLPPPPPPRPKVDQVKFPPPVVRSKKGNVIKFGKPQSPKPKVDQVRFPPPVIKPDAQNTVTGQTKVTSKGFIYEDGGFIADNKGDMFVIIYTKGKAQNPVYRSSATAEQISTLKNSYGYKFPDLKIFPGMPPPPLPVATDQN